MLYTLSLTSTTPLPVDQALFYLFFLLHIKYGCGLGTVTAGEKFGKIYSREISTEFQGIHK